MSNAETRNIDTFLKIRFSKILEKRFINFQVLDASYNRIRELNNNSFARYTHIKYLYLNENMIQVIEATTFAQLTSLEVFFLKTNLFFSINFEILIQFEHLKAIDLSANGLTTLPMELFSLPLLRNIHASDNYLVNLHKDLQVG